MASHLEGSYSEAISAVGWITGAGVTIPLDALCRPTRSLAIDSLSVEMRAVSSKGFSSIIEFRLVDGQIETSGW